MTWDTRVLTLAILIVGLILDHRLTRAENYIATLKQHFSFGDE